MSIIDTLVTDRSIADIATLKSLLSKSFTAMSTAEQAAWLQDSKGAYNASDLNRVGQALNYLNQLMTLRCGKMFSWTAKVDWTYQDVPTLAQLQNYAQQITDVRNALVVPASTASVPKMPKLTYQQANDIEVILQLCDQLVKNVIAAFKYTGVTECAVGGLI